MSNKLKDAFVTVIASNFGKSLKFYTETLGLKLRKNYGNEYAEIAAPGMTIGIHPKESGDKPGNMKGVQIGFAVADIHAVVRELKKKGVKFKGGIIDDGWGLLAFFVDPDNNMLYLGQEKKNW